MKPLLISFLTLFLLHSKASCQTPIKLEDINKHIGDSVKICNKIYGGGFLSRLPGSPTYLYVGNDAPYNPLAVMIAKKDRENFEDSPEMMKTEAVKQGYQFPYLYDADQSVAIAYNAACTPDLFVFDSAHRLVYRGQLDDSRPRTDRPLTGKDLRTALDCILNGKQVGTEQRPSVGCNIKWKDGLEPEYFNPAGTA